MIMFTGSTRTGKKVAVAAAERLIPCSLELGGKDPMIVLRDADLERAANTAVFYSMQNSGQTCISVERVYVEAPVYDEFVQKVTQKVSALRQGRADRAGLRRGRLDDVPAADRHRRAARRRTRSPRARRCSSAASAARARASSSSPPCSTDVDHTMDAMTEETFGPTLPIMKVEDAEEAIRLANDSIYGLGGSVFSKDLAKGEAVARRVNSGAVCVNDAHDQLRRARAADGRRQGVRPRRRATAPAASASTASRRRSSSRGSFPKRDMHMFPYTAKSTNRIGTMLKLINRGKK